MNKIWPNDFKVGCKSFSNLVEFIAVYAYLEEELENLKEFLEGMKLWRYNILDLKNIATFSSLKKYIYF